MTTNKVTSIKYNKGVYYGLVTENRYEVNPLFEQSRSLTDSHLMSPAEKFLVRELGLSKESTCTSRFRI